MKGRIQNIKWKCLIFQKNYNKIGIKKIIRNNTCNIICKDNDEIVNYYINVITSIYSLLSLYRMNTKNEMANGESVELIKKNDSMTKSLHLLLYIKYNLIHNKIEENNIDIKICKEKMDIISHSFDDNGLEKYIDNHNIMLQLLDKLKVSRDIKEKIYNEISKANSLLNNDIIFNNLTILDILYYYTKDISYLYCYYEYIKKYIENNFMYTNENKYVVNKEKGFSNIIDTHIQLVQYTLLSNGEEDSIFNCKLVEELNLFYKKFMRVVKHAKCFVYKKYDKKCFAIAKVNNINKPYAAVSGGCYFEKIIYNDVSSILRKNFKMARIYKSKYYDYTYESFKQFCKKHGKLKYKKSEYYKKDGLLFWML